MCEYPNNPNNLITYVSALLQYVQCFSLKYHDHMLLVSVDDKSIIPVGEPSCPVSTGVRGHTRSLVPLNGPHLQAALYHDFHVHGIVPSVSQCAYDGNRFFL